MKLMKRAAACAAAFAVFMQCGCSRGDIVQIHKDQTEITLSWWGNDERTEYTLEAVHRFEELHPDIKVHSSYSEWSGYEARSRIRMISETEADVMQINVGWLSEFSPDGSGYYDLRRVSDILDLSNFTDSALEYGTMNGVLNAVPIAMNAETVYFNETLFKKYGLELPRTWDELFNAAGVMKKDGIFPLSGVAKSIWLYTIAYAEQNTGKSVCDENGRLAFTADEYKLMIEFYVRMVKEKVIPKVEDFKKNRIEEGQYAGSVAWVSDAMNYFGSSIKRGDNVVAFDYTALSPERSGEGWYKKPATLYAMSKNTEHPEEAAMLLNYLLNGKDMALLQGIEKGIPISTAAAGYLTEADMLNGLQYEASQVMSNCSVLGKMTPVMENNDVITKFIECCNLVLYDKASSEEAAQELYMFCRENDL